MGKLFHRNSALYASLGQSRYDEPELVRFGAGKRFDVCQLNVDRAPKPQARFLQKEVLVAFRIARAADDPEDDCVHTVLRYLCFLDIDHVFENVIQTSDLPAIRSDHVVFNPAVDAFHYAAGPPATA